MACGILFPGLEIESVSSTLDGRVLTTGPLGKPPVSLLIYTENYLQQDQWLTVVYTEDAYAGDITHFLDMKKKFLKKKEKEKEISW